MEACGQSAVTAARPEVQDDLDVVWLTGECIGPLADRNLQTSPLSGWTGLRIAGEVDISNHDQFRRALAPVFASGIIAVHLDVSGLRFIDVAGTRELIALTRSHPHLRLIVHRPPASLRRIVEVLWPNVDIEIRIDNPVSGLPASGQSVH